MNKFVHIYLHFKIFKLNQLSKNKIEPIEPTERIEPKLELSTFRLSLAIFKLNKIKLNNKMFELKQAKIKSHVSDKLKCKKNILFFIIKNKKKCKQFFSKNIFFASNKKFINTVSHVKHLRIPYNNFQYIKTGLFYSIQYLYMAKLYRQTPNLIFM